ncbi:MAG: SUMF1/EgtB/PvdO family nonheme iron enzyme [Treponema sp.]|nr:SUMF1/EgtB/PvdO family nonheme iron enzyme [Treponema sp.]
MKKLLFVFTATLALTCIFVVTSCGGDVSASVENGVTVSATSSIEGITGSRVFISGRTVGIWARWACDHEVTQDEYLHVMGNNPSRLSSSLGRENHPVDNVTWYNAIVYCNKRSLAEGLTPCYAIDGITNPDDWGTPSYSWNAVECNFSANGYRLPTEAEWEYLARGGNTSNVGQTKYSGSDAIENVAWYDGNAYDVGEDDSNYGTHPVKQKLPNALGLYDMSGNVYEWCWDWYGTIDTSTPASGPSSGSERILRGGSWYHFDSQCTVHYCNSAVPSYTCDANNCYGRTFGGHFGFRVVRSCFD